MRFPPTFPRWLTPFAKSPNGSPRDAPLLQPPTDPGEPFGRRAITRELLAGRTPPYVEADRNNWNRSINWLLQNGDLKAAERAARHVHAAAPYVTFPRTVCEIFDRLPRAPLLRNIRVEPGTTYQVFPRRGANVALLLFTHGSYRLGLPWPLVSRWFARTRAHLVLMRDPKGLYFTGGVEGLGQDFHETVAALRGIAADLGARNIACCGASIGQFAALQYGLALGARSVLGFAGPTNITAGFALEKRPLARAQVIAAVDERELDLRPLYAAANSPPRVRLVHGEAAWNDRIQAENMAGLPTVEIERIAGSANHSIVPDVIVRGRFAPLLDWVTG